MRLSVTTNLKQAQQELRGIAEKQIPFATALALTETAKLAGAGVRRQLPTIFDRPTPFTMNSIAVTPARKNNLVARVFVKDKQAAYLQVQEDGGAATPKKQAFVLPRAIGTNAYGNMPKGALQRAKAKPNVFVGKVAGVGGFWFRPKGKPLQLLVQFISRAIYKPRFRFKERVSEIAQRAIRPAFAEAMAKAMRTARR